MLESTTQHSLNYAVTAAPWALPGAPVLLRGDMNEQIKKAKLLGYDAIELHLRVPDDANIRELHSLCEEYDIHISAVATGLSKLVDKLCFIDDDPKIRVSAVDRIKRFIDWSSEFNCGIIVGSMRGSIPNLNDRSLYDQRMLECLRDIVDYAEPAKVPIHLEVINRYENNYLNTAKETLEYIKNFNTDNLYVHLDTFHMNIEESNIENAIMLCGSKLGYIHFADNNRHACGEGFLDFKKIQMALKNISYKGYASVECLPIPDGFTAAKKSIEYLKAEEKKYDCSCK